MADTVVVGAGTAGCAVAALLAERSGEHVLLLEAGPDYGARASGRWPADLLGASALPDSHQWGYDSRDVLAPRVLPFPRGRVVGGCSAINHCGIARGSRLDYDAWAAAGCEGWSTDELLPLFESASARLAVHRYADDEITPFHRAFVESARAAGWAEIDVEDVAAVEGAGYFAANVVDGVRFNAAFAYLDPARALPNLTISGGAPVDRVVLDGGRATGVILADGRRVEAGRVVLAAGSFGSPAILLRSGVGPAAAHPLAGVGENLHDHATVRLRYAGSEALARETDAFLARARMPLGQSVVLARSSVAGAAYDLHVFPHELELEDGGWGVKIPVAAMTPRSRGTVRLAGADPSAAPLIDHAYLADEADVTAIVDGIAIARRIAATQPVAALMGAELEPGSDVRDEELRAWVRAEIASYYHPAGTCAMGPPSDSRAVVGPDGSVHGLDGLAVADASVMPSIPRANTNLPTAVVAERIAHHLIEGAR